MGAWRLGGVEVSDFRSWYEEYGQLIPAIDERRTPTFTEHAAFADENRERARAALDGPCPDIGAVRVLAEHDPADAPRPVGRPAPAAWTDDGLLHVLWRGAHRSPLLGGGLQGPPLWPVGGCTDAWSRAERGSAAAQPAGMVAFMPTSRPPWRWFVTCDTGTNT